MTDGYALTPTSGAGLSDLEHRLLLAANSGGSGRGMSFWSTAASCGRRATLDEARNERLRILEMPPPETPGYYIVGSTYHALHDLCRREPTADLAEPLLDANVVEGMRLFQGWREAWPLDFWGETLAAECVLPVRSEAEIRKAFGGEMVNAKPDMVVHMDEQACTRAAYRGLAGLQPGNYIIDWKTSARLGDGMQYTAGLQASWYPTAWNIEHPDAPVRGIIFDVIGKKFKSFDARAFSAHYAEALPVEAGLARLRGMVDQGARNIASGQCNAAACRDWRGATCPYLGRQGGCS